MPNGEARSASLARLDQKVLLLLLDNADQRLDGFVDLLKRSLCLVDQSLELVLRHVVRLQLGCPQKHQFVSAGTRLALTSYLFVLAGHFCDLLTHLSQFKLHLIDILLQLVAFIFGTLHTVLQFMNQLSDVVSLSQAKVHSLKKTGSVWALTRDQVAIAFIKFEIITRSAEWYYFNGFQSRGKTVKSKVNLASHWALRRWVQQCHCKQQGFCAH